MKSLDFLKEGFVEDANEANQDHEVQMARQECFHAAEHALALHKLLRNISEAQGLEGWVSSKITLANDYLQRVREYLEYELLTKDINDEAPALTIAEDQESKKKNQIVEYKVSGAELGSENYTINDIELNALQNVASNYYDRPVKIAQSQDNPDLYTINVAMTVGPVNYGSYNASTRTASLVKRMTDKGDLLQKVLKGIAEGQSEEERAESERQMQDFLSKGGKIQQVQANRGPRRSGASLASHHIGGMGDARTGRRSQMRGLGSNPTGKLLVAKESEGVAEGLQQTLRKVVPGYAKREINKKMDAGKFGKTDADKDANFQRYKKIQDKLKEQGVAEGAKCNHTMEGENCPVHGLKECGSYGKVEEMTAGSVATVVNPPAKNKSKVGTLFGGTYKQKKVKEAKQMTFPGENTKPPQRPGDQVRGTEKATKPNPFKHRLVGNE